MSRFPKILLLSPTIPATGNTSTISRLHNHFYMNNIDAVVHDISKCSQCEFSCLVKKVNSLIVELSVSQIIILHAYKSGIFVVCSCGNNCRTAVKYGIVYGGTDLNIDVNNVKNRAVIKEAIMNAHFTVAFTEDMQQIVKSICPNSKVLVHPQCLDYNLFKQCKVEELTPKTKQAVDVMFSKPLIFVVASSLRNVKDPLYVAQNFLKWKCTLHPKKDVRLLILGAVADPVFAVEFFRKLLLFQKLSDVSTTSTLCCDGPVSQVSVALAPNITKACPPVACDVDADLVVSWINDPGGATVQFIPAVSQPQFLEYCSRGLFYALVNTSKSEGMASSILEAMGMGVPVIVRDIPGNRAVVKDKWNGLLFSSPEEFISNAQRLLDSPQLGLELALNAKNYILNNHSPYQEAKFYINLVRDIL